MGEGRGFTCAADSAITDSGPGDEVLGHVDHIDHVGLTLPSDRARAIWR